MHLLFQNGLVLSCEVTLVRECICLFLRMAVFLCLQNGLVLSPAEMFKLKSCIRRKTDSIDKRFCFDVEVVERCVAALNLLGGSPNYAP